MTKLWWRNPAAATAASTIALSVKCGDVVFVAADLPNIRKCRPNEVLDTSALGGIDRCGALSDLVGSTRLPEIGDGKHAVRAFKGVVQRFRAVEIRRDDLVGQPLMLGRVAGEGPDAKLTASLQGANDAAALMSACADHGDQWVCLVRHSLVLVMRCDGAVARRSAN